MVVALIILFFPYLKLINLKSKVPYLKFLVNFYTLTNMDFYKFYLVIIHQIKKGLKRGLKSVCKVLFGLINLI